MVGVRKEGKGREEKRVTNKTHWECLDPEGIRDPHDTRQEGAEDTRGVGKMKKTGLHATHPQREKGRESRRGVLTGRLWAYPPSCRLPGATSCREHVARENRTRLERKQREAEAGGKQAATGSTTASDFGSMARDGF